MKKLLEKIIMTNEKYRLFEKNDRILIALSGGPDSVALFHLLELLAHDWNLTLGTAHINHCLRQEAEYDRRFCRFLSRAYGCKFHSKKVDIKAAAGRRQIGLEQAGREARYDFFRKLCREYGYNKIATAHTADDSAETFLLNLIRGADFAGLRGIPPLRDNVIRPLIEFEKAEILGFLKSNGLSFRVDTSNLADDHNRNLIRNKVIPVLKKINSGAQSHIARAARNLRASYGYLEDEVEKLYRSCLVDESNTQIILDLRKLPAYYESLKSWILLRAYFRLTDDFRRPDSVKIERAVNLRRRGTVTLLDSGIIVSNHAGKLILSRPPGQIKRIRLKRNGCNRINDSGLALQTEVSEEFDLNFIQNNDDESIAYLDDERIGLLTVRAFKEGDNFRPLGLKGTKKVADYLNDKGVPLVNKKSIPIILSDNDIIWVAGFGIAENYKVTDGTRRVLKIQMIRDMVVNEDIYIGRENRR